MRVKGLWTGDWGRKKILAVEWRGIRWACECNIRRHRPGGRCHFGCGYLLRTCLDFAAVEVDASEAAAGPAVVAEGDAGADWRVPGLGCVVELGWEVAGGRAGVEAAVGIPGLADADRLIEEEEGLACLRVGEVDGALGEVAVALVVHLHLLRGEHDFVELASAEDVWIAADELVGGGGGGLNDGA